MTQPSIEPDPYEPPQPFDLPVDSASAAQFVEPQKRKAALGFIFIVALLDVLSLGLLIPVVPLLIEQFLDGDTAKASQVAGLFGTVWALMHFIFAPVLGTLSDRFGRRRVILISCTGLGLDYLILAVAPNLWWLFIGRILSGITAASFSTASAYVADVTPPEKRAAAFGMYIGSAWGLGFVLGPAIGGVLGEIGLRVPMWCAAGLTLVNVLYGYFILPESLAPENRSKFSLANANPIGSLKLLRSQQGLFGLACVLLIYQLAHQVMQNVFVLYTKHRYEWTPKTVGACLFTAGVLSVIMQAFVVRKTAAWLGEWRMVLIALTFGGLGYALFGQAPTGMLFWAGIPVYSLAGYFNPGIQALMTRRVGPDSQGQLQGANSSIMGIAGMIGPTIFTSIFAMAIADSLPTQLPGAPFFLSAFLHLIAIGVLVQLWRKSTP